MAHIYHYDNQGLYINQSEARINPREKTPTPLVPRNATLAEPPKTGQHEIAKFEDGFWTLVADYRGHRYFTLEGGEERIIEVGINPPNDAIPLKELDRLIQGEDKIWHIATDEDDLNDYKRNKIKELEAWASADINSGFLSAALGKSHKYDSEQHNIAWIMSAVILGNDAAITCDDLNKGNKDRKIERLHTKEQSRQVLIDAMGSLLDHKTTLIDRRNQVMASKSNAQVDKI